MSLLVFLSACATTPSTKVGVTVTAKTGDVVHLFPGGNKLAKEELTVVPWLPVPEPCRAANKNLMPGVNLFHLYFYSVNCNAQFVK